MSETIGDIIRELCTIDAAQDRAIYVVCERSQILPLESYPGSVVDPFSFKIERRTVTLFQLRYRLMEAYRYEREEPAKKLLRLVVDAFRRERCATLFDLVAQAEDFLKRTSKTSNPTPESEVSNGLNN